MPVLVLPFLLIRVLGVRHRGGRKLGIEREVGILCYPVFAHPIRRIAGSVPEV